MAEVYRGYLPGESSVEDIPILGPVVSALSPVERDVITPPETTYVEDMGVRYPVTTAGEYGDPRVGTPAAVQGILDFVQFLKNDPKAAATAAAEGIMSIPEQQYYGGLARLNRFDAAFDPETGEEFRYDDFLLPATSAIGTAASIAREGPGGVVLGMMGGEGAVSGTKKKKKFESALKGGFLRNPADEREAFSRTKGYIEPSDGKFRFEIDTSKADLGKAWTQTKRKVTGQGTEENPEFYYSIDFQKRMQDGKAFDTPTLGELLDFPELFKEYPDLADIPVKQMPPFSASKGQVAAYDMANDEIYLGVGSRKDLMASILHEVQHAIQEREGFTRGTAVDRYLPDNHRQNLQNLQKSSNKKAKELAAELEAKAVEMGIPSSKINVGQFNLARKAKAYFSGNPEEYGYFDFSTVADQKQLQQLAELVDDEQTINAMYDAIIDANKLYQRQPGEVEARTVQKKFEEGRQGEFPRDVQDTPPEDYVYNIEMQKMKGAFAEKAEGGVVSMVDVARNAGRGPRGVASLAPVARNMNRSMLG